LELVEKRKRYEMKQKSQRQLAREFDISPAYLSMILSGQRNPNTELRNKLCSQGLFTSEATVCLGSKHSTTELHPPKPYLF
jgi:transcriptional regulator with XRE-family HTH domain